MPVSQHDVAHLLTLIEAAKSHAERLGPDMGPACHLLDQALIVTREIQANGGRADEGLRPQNLTTENGE